MDQLSNWKLLHSILLRLFNVFHEQKPEEDEEIEEKKEELSPLPGDVGAAFSGAFGGAIPKPVSNVSSTTPFQYMRTNHLFLLYNIL